MADIGGEYDETPAGPDANELQPGRMAACCMYRKAGSKLAIAIRTDGASSITATVRLFAGVSSIA